MPPCQASSFFLILITLFERQNWIPELIVTGWGCKEDGSDAHSNGYCSLLRCCGDGLRQWYSRVQRQWEEGREKWIRSRGTQKEELGDGQEGRSWPEQEAGVWKLWPTERWGCCGHASRTQYKKHIHLLFTSKSKASTATVGDSWSDGQEIRQGLTATFSLAGRGPGNFRTIWRAVDKQC